MKEENQDRFMDIPDNGRIAEVVQDLPLITTKLKPPRLALPLVTRHRLLESLKPVRFRKLATVEAAAGFGKTTLLAQWHFLESNAGSDIAWLSLSDEDNHPRSFALYVVAALSKFTPGLQHLMKPKATTPRIMIYRTLINELASRKQDIYLIIDDYHCVTNEKIHEDVIYLLTHAPKNFHLLIGARNEPPLQLASLYSQGQLLQIKDDELRFTLEEVKDYFNSEEAPKLSTTNRQQLLDLTEGWVTGLQLASLSPDLNIDPNGAIKSMSSGVRAINRYLREIIFDQLDESTLQFLIQTSILKRLCAPVCEAVTGREDSQEILEQLESRKLFLYALDDTGEWYRYHNLFTHALRLELKRDKTITQTELHERASRWFAANNFWSEAVRHALAANKIDGTLASSEQGVRSLAEEGDLDTLIDWLHRLPVESHHSRVHFQLTLIWGLTHRLQLTEAHQLIEDLDQALAKNDQLLEPSQLQEFKVVKAIYLAFTDDSLAVKEICEPLIEDLPLSSSWVTGLACNVISWSYLAESRYNQMEVVQRYAPISDKNESNLFAKVYRHTLLGLGCIRQAQFDKAQSYLTEALELATNHTGPESTGAATSAAFLAEIYYERAEWDKLDSLLGNHLHLIEKIVMLDGQICVYFAVIREVQSLNDHNYANQLIEYSLQLALQHRWYRFYAAMLHEQIRQCLTQNETDKATTAFRQLELLWEQHQTDKPSAKIQIRWYLIQAKARILIHKKKNDEAADILMPLLTEQEQLGNDLLAIRLRVILALAYQNSGRSNLALEALHPALIIAGQQRIIRCFLDEGEPIRQLLEGAAQQNIDNQLPKDFIDKLLHGFQDSAPNPSTKEKRPLVIEGTVLHMLSHREQETLALVAQGQSNKEIAQSLDISAETVKWHLKNIYTKLEVNGRIPAISKAQELGLLA